MEQFSHDLTIALEETSRCGGVRSGRWGLRRRTRSTGNLPCAPQPTEDSSSSPAADGATNAGGADGANNSILSDSDDRQELKLSLKSRQSCMFGNFESDSLNENFSPARPNTRRKRKFKRMAVEYETTPSTPGTTNPTAIFPIAGTVKKRVLKHTSQENFRANLFFCGKRKRSHRDRYYEQHSSSVPRQRDFFAPKNSYMEYRSRNRSFSSSKPCERIMPLNKSIISKIEKISQTPADIKAKISGFQFLCIQDRDIKMAAASSTTVTTATPMATLSSSSSTSLSMSNTIPVNTFVSLAAIDAAKGGTNNAAVSGRLALSTTTMAGSNNATTTTTTTSSTDTLSAARQPQLDALHKMAQKSGSFESTFKSSIDSNSPSGGGGISSSCKRGNCGNDTIKYTKDQHHHHHHNHHHQCSSSSSSDNIKKHKHSKRHQLKMRLQFEDPNLMDCGNLNEFLSSSSLSSSDSEAAETNESDREGDDELTDWPGNEAMVNFTSKNDFKRARPRLLKPTLPQIKSDELAQDDDTLMSADEILLPAAAGSSSSLAASSLPKSSIINIQQQQPPNTLNLSVKYSPAASLADITPLQTMPIDILDNLVLGQLHRNQVESEMSGETSNHFLSSPNTCEVREIRAGCRRIRDERPGFTILTSVNEELSKFLQDARQEQLTLPDTDAQEHEKLLHLAKLYSLNMHVENGCAILTKTSNTTQSVKIDQSSISKRFLSDYKRRCYGGEYDDDDDPESSGMAS